MDSFDKKSLHLLAGIKPQLNECMNTPTSALSAPRTPASLNITANSGDELSQMLKDIASMGAKDYAPTPYAGHNNDIAHLDHSQIVGVPAFADLLSKIDQYDEIKDDVDHAPLGSEPDERIMAGRNFPLDGDQNNSVVAAGDELVHRGITSESLMDEYYNFLRENGVSPYKNPENLTQLNNNIRSVATKLGKTPDEVEKMVRDHMKENPQSEPMNDEDIENIVKEPAKTAIGAPKVPTVPTASTAPTSTFESLLKRINELNEKI